MRRILLTATAIPLLLASTARAEPQDDSPTTVEEVVVTAAPFSVTEQALTANVDVVDSEELLQAPPATLGDLVSGMPGVRSSSFAPGASRPVIRGLAGPRVQVLVNGLGAIDASQVSADHQVAADPGEASRIEILRGPSTLAYGGSAIGGVVNIIDDRVPRERPEGGIDGRLTGQVGSVDASRAANGAVTVGNGPWVFTVQGVARDSEDYEISGPAMSQRLANALGVPREGASEVINSFSRLREWGLGGAYVGDEGYLGASVKRTRSNYGTVVEPEVNIDLEQTRYDVRGEYGVRFGPFERVRGAAGFADYTHTEFEGAEPGTIFTSKGWEGRLELVQQEREGWNGAFGVQALSRDFNAIGDEAFVPQTNIDEVGAYTLQRLDRGPFGFEAGFRIDQRTLETLAATRDFTNISASAGIFFRPVRGLYLGLSAARNERAPTEVELFADGPHVATAAFEIGNPDFDSETASSLEAALHFTRGRFSTDLHLYVAHYDGFIDQTPTGVIDIDSGLEIFQYVQTNADFRGFEVEASWRVWENDAGRSIILEGAADYVRGDTDLGPPARIPPWSATARLVYEAPRWDAKLEVRRVAQQDRVAANELPTDGFTMVNLSASYKLSEDPAVILFAEARNLTDAEGREHASFLKDIAPMPGRGFRAGLAYRF